MEEIIVMENQSLLDISVQVYGDATGMFQLAMDNNLGITDSLVPGQVLQYNPKNIVNKQTAEYYKANNIKPATGITEEIADDENRIFDDPFDNPFE